MRRYVLGKYLAQDKGGVLKGKMHKFLINSWTGFSSFVYSLANSLLSVTFASPKN
jgi:hypothetical protein